MGGGYVFKACRSSAECAPSMVCLGDRCSCPLGYGIDHPPDCQHRTPWTYYVIVLLVVSIVLQLLLAALHVVSLRAHWRLSAQHICCQGGEGDSPLRRPQLQRRDVDAGGDGEAAAAAASHHPNSGRGATPSHSSGRSQAKLQQGGGGGGGQRTVAERVLSCKSLFSIFSVLFLLTGLPFRVARLVLLLARPGTVPVHLVAQDSQSWVAVLNVVSFTFMVWSCLIVGRIWLDVAAGFGSAPLQMVSDSQITTVIFVLCAIINLSQGVEFWSHTSNDARTYSYLIAMGWSGVVSLGYIMLGSYIIINNIRRRAKQVRDSAELQGAEPEDSSSSQAREEQLLMRLYHMLRKRKRQGKMPKYVPHLSRISEAEDSALERSSHRSLLLSTSRASFMAEALKTGGALGSLPEEGEGQIDDEEEDEEAGGQAWQGVPNAGRLEAAVVVSSRGTAHNPIASAGGGAALASEPRRAPAHAQELAGGGGATSPAGGGGAASADLEALAALIATSAVKVGLAFLLSIGSTLAGLRLGKLAGERQDVSLGAASFTAVLLGFPLFHLWGNLACLLVVSKDARAALARALDAFDMALGRVVGCCCAPDYEEDE